MDSSSNDETGDDLKSVDSKESPHSRGSASVSDADTDAELVSDTVSRASSSASDTPPQDINYDKLLNFILQITTGDNDLEGQIEKFVVNMINNIQSGADSILLKSMMIYFIVVIDYKLFTMQDDNEKAKNKIEIFKEVLSKNNFHESLIGNVIDETEIGEVLESIQNSDPLIQRFIDENKQYILAIINLMPYSYFNMFIDLYKFSKQAGGYGLIIGGYDHIIKSYTPIITPHNTLLQLTWYKDKIIKSIVTVENFLSSMWRSVDINNTFKYEHKSPKHQNDIKDAMNIIKQLKKHVDEQKSDTLSHEHKEMLKKMLDYIKTQLFGEIYGYWQGKEINYELFYNAADESIHTLYNLQPPVAGSTVAQFTSPAPVAAAEKKLSPRAADGSVSNKSELQDIERELQQLRERQTRMLLQYSHESDVQFTQLGSLYNGHRSQTPHTTSLGLSKLLPTTSQVHSMPPQTMFSSHANPQSAPATTPVRRKSDSELVREQHQSQSQKARASSSLTSHPPQSASPRRSHPPLSTRRSQPSLSPRTISAHATPPPPPPQPPRPVRHLPLPFIPQPPQKVDYHNLKYAKFKPLPEFTKYYPTYVGLAALKAVPLLKQVFNTDEQTIWKYMQKRSILFNKTNKEKEFASKLIFAVLAEQITKNIRNDFDIKDINFQNLIEIELLKMLNNDRESVKYMTKLVYKNIYDSIVIKLFE